jgi:hypothetical protein
MMTELRGLFSRYERDGRVAIDYETHVYYSRFDCST